METPATVMVVRIVDQTMPVSSDGGRLLPGSPSQTHKASVIHLASGDGTINLRLSQRDPADFPAGTVFELSLVQAA